MAQCILPIWEGTYATGNVVTSAINELEDEIKASNQRTAELEHKVRSIKHTQWRRAMKTRF